MGRPGKRQRARVKMNRPVGWVYNGAGADWLSFKLGQKKGGRWLRRYISVGPAALRTMSVGTGES